MVSEWSAINKDFQTYTQIQIPRKICDGSSVKLHAFSDATMKASSTVGYICDGKKCTFGHGESQNSTY